MLEKQMNSRAPEITLAAHPSAQAWCDKGAVLPGIEQ